jgi:hypothetical protein
LALLQSSDVRYAYAGYWLAYRVTFETREHVIVDPTYTTRFPPYDAVRQHPEAAYLFVNRTKSRTRFFAYCSQHNIPLTIAERGVFTMAIPARQVFPEQVGDVTVWSS